MSNSIGNGKRRNSKLEKLIGEAQRLGRKIYTQETVDKLEERVKQYSSGIDGKDRRVELRWLAHTYKECGVQLEHLGKCEKTLRKFFMEKHSPTDENLNEFCNGFRHLVSEDNSESEEDSHELKMLKALEKRISTWTDIKEKIELIRPKISVIQSILMLSDTTSIEMASLFLSLFIWLGYLYLINFYSPIVDNISAYLTLEDLINRGLQVLWVVLIFWIFIEVLFFVLQYLSRFVNERAAKKMYWYLIRKPLFLAIPSVILLNLFIIQYGTFEGERKLKEFGRLTPESAQVATVLDGTILKEVFLVGTTATTATFLKVDKWGKRVEDAQNREGPGACIRDHDKPNDSLADREQKKCVANHHVLIMDRALVVCHAKGDVCLKLKKNDTPPEIVQMSDSAVGGGFDP